MKKKNTNSSFFFKYNKKQGVELTHPIPEDFSSGILMTSGQLTGIAFIYGFSALIKQQTTCGEKIVNGYSYEYTGANVMLLVIVASATFIIYFFNEENNRLKEDGVAIVSFS